MKRNITSRTEIDLRHHSVRRLWRAGISIGVNESVPEGEAKHIRITNGVVIAATFVNFTVLIYSIVTLTGNQLASQLVSIGFQLSILVLVIGLNRARRFVAARIVFYAIFLFFVAYGSFSAPSGFHYVSLVVGLSAFYLFPMHQRYLMLVIAAIYTGIFILFESEIITPGVPGANHPFATVSVEQWRVARLINLAISGVLLLVTGVYATREIARAEVTIDRERARADSLLHQVLPKEIVKRMKEGESTIADDLDEVSILFADLVGFTELSESKSAKTIVAMLDDLFRAFDEIADGLGLEKIKTIGDSYMAASGVPVEISDHRRRIVEMALAMNRVVRSREEFEGIKLRIGINSGSVVAGVIGDRKFLYDLWGDAVNVASRMESHGVPGEIQTTREFADAIRDEYRVESRGIFEVKGKGKLELFLVKEGTI